MAYIGTSPTNITNVADDLIDEANLKVSNTPINGYFLSAQSGNTGGLTWATAPAGYADSDVDAHLLTSGVTLDATNDRVGIGTSSPAHALDIVESANAFGARITNNSDSSQGLQIRTSDNDTGQYILDLQTSSSATGTDYASKFVVEKGGKVGIGTNAPTEELVVQGAVNAECEIMLRTDGGINCSMFTANPTGDHALGFKTNGTERFRFGTSGQLGIGGANYGSSGQYLKSNGSGSAPSWASVSSGYTYGSSPTFNNLTVQSSSTFNSSLTCNSTLYCQQINVAGTTYYGGGTYLTNWSDDRLKVKSNNIPEALSKISQLDGFYYTDSDTVTDLIRGTNSDGTVNLIEKETAQKVGVSAQELEKVLPEAVGKTLTEQSATETQYLTVDYAKIVPLLVEGIKELTTKVETLETKVAALEAD